MSNYEDFNKILMLYRKKVSGLVFLNALTLVNIAPKDDDEDWVLLGRTKSHFVNNHQIDLKAMLPIMVRQPFSQIFIELQSELYLGDERYEILFNKCMENNTAYSSILTNFDKINYGEQFFDPETGQPLDLQTVFEPLFKPEFWNKNKSVLVSLLSQGVVSTAMIRNFIPDIMVRGEEHQPAATILQQYLPTLITSVDFPNKRYIISTSKGSPGVKCEKSSFDGFSPPWFLDSENSMGRIKEPLKSEDKVFGEVIVEIRAIRNVQPWFLKRIGLAPQGIEDGVIREGNFLCNPTDNLIGEVTALFKFVSNFSFQEDYFKHVDFGIGNALCKFINKKRS